MITFNNDKAELTIKLENYDGARLLALQKALLLGIEEIGCCERRDGKEYGDAILELTWLLRAAMLTDSQTNVALGGKPYKVST